MINAIETLIEGFARIRERARGRRVLLDMDARMLKDIGLSRDIVAAEATKPWWRD